MSTKDGGPAFPRPEVTIDCPSGDSYQIEGQDGMSLRDYFAAKAMHAALSQVTEFLGDVTALADRDGKRPGEVIAKMAYAYADDMLAERAK